MSKTTFSLLHACTLSAGILAVFVASSGLARVHRDSNRFGVRNDRICAAAAEAPEPIDGATQYDGVRTGQAFRADGGVPETDRIRWR